MRPSSSTTTPRPCPPTTPSATSCISSPCAVEDVMNVIELEKPMGVVVSLGGQTAINLAEPAA